MNTQNTLRGSNLYSFASRKPMLNTGMGVDFTPEVIYPKEDPRYLWRHFGVFTPHLEHQCYRNAGKHMLNYKRGKWFFANVNDTPVFYHPLTEGASMVLNGELHESMPPILAGAVIMRESLSLIRSTLAQIKSTREQDSLRHNIRKNKEVIEGLSKHYGYTLHW